MLPARRHSTGRATVAALAVALLGLTGAASAKETTPAVLDSTRVLTAQGGTDSLVARRLTFAYPVAAMALDTTTLTLVVTYKDPTAKAPNSGQSLTDPAPILTTLAYDLRAKRMRWLERDPELKVVDAYEGVAVLARGAHVSLRRIDDGSRLPGAGDQAFAEESTHVVIVVDDDEIRALNPVTGDAVWSVDRGGITGPMTYVRAPGRLVLGGEGVLTVDLATRQTWEYPMPASRSQVFMVGGNGGFDTEPTLYSLFRGHQIVGLASTPFVSNGRAYFAAETTVVCLELDTGRCVWRQQLRRERTMTLRQRALGAPLRPEFPGRMIVRDAGTNIAVVSLGWAPGRSGMWLADEPTITLMSKADGHVVARIGIDGVHKVNDALWTGGTLFVLAHDRMVALDDSLRVRRIIKSTSDADEFFDFLACDRAAVLVARTGLTAIAPDSLGTVWQRRVGLRDCAPTIDDLDTGAARGDVSGWVASALALTEIGHAGDCQPGTTFPLPRVASARIRRGYALLSSDRTVSVVRLPTRGR